MTFFELLAYVVFWYGLYFLAICLGVITLFLGVTLADWWRDRNARERAEELIAPQVRTLCADLDRIWGLPTAPDRSLQAERTSLVAAIYDAERHGVRF